MYETAALTGRIARFRAASSHRMMREMAGFVREQKNNQTNDQNPTDLWSVENTITGYSPEMWT
ncbi:hypothetical protein KML24004_15370 [Alistipes indistinctus]|jgi:hypothetical protein